MSVTSLASFKGAREKKQKKEVSRRARVKPRYLGGKDVHLAKDHYECCRCIFSIMPGDGYRRERYVRSYMTNEGERSYFYFERYHLPQCYGPTEKEDREIREEIERQRETEKEAGRHAA
jgi:hypothetical protein